MTEALTIHSRKPLTKLQRAVMFDEHKGICVICEFKIDHTQRWQDEHIIPLALGGSNALSNRGPAHEKCSKAKDKTDLNRIAKAKRQHANHVGAKRPKKQWPKRGFGRQQSNTKYVNEGY